MCDFFLVSLSLFLYGVLGQLCCLIVSIFAFLLTLRVAVDWLFIVTPIAGVCNCSMFCCTLLYVHFSFAIILMGKRELLLCLVCLPGVS